eukprot:712597-Rhodomonas_salina.3
MSGTHLGYSLRIPSAMLGAQTGYLRMSATRCPAIALPGKMGFVRNLSVHEILSQVRDRGACVT